MFSCPLHFSVSTFSFHLVCCFHLPENLLFCGSIPMKAIGNLSPQIRSGQCSARSALDQSPNRQSTISKLPSVEIHPIQKHKKYENNNKMRNKTYYTIFLRMNLHFPAILLQGFDPFPIEQHQNLPKTHPKPIKHLRIQLLGSPWVTPPSTAPQARLPTDCKAALGVRLGAIATASRSPST